LTLEAKLDRIIEILEIAIAQPPKDVTAETSSVSAATPVTVAAPKKGPGRPPKAKPVEAAPPVEAEVEADPFGDDAAEADPFAEEEAEAAPLTHDDVRNAAIAYQKKPGKTNEMARQILKKVGGVDNLTKLPEGKFAAVIDAYNK
jgi:hypothetical protein